MYAKVSEEIRDPLLKTLRRTRRNSFVKYFPVLVVCFSLLLALVVFVKGHALIYLLEKLVRSRISETALIAIFAGTILIITMGGLIFFHRQDYAECKLENYLYCPKCNAVDNYDEGRCPICAVPLTKKETFIYVFHKEEKDLIKRWGLLICQEAKSPNFTEDKV